MEKPYRCRKCKGFYMRRTKYGWECETCGWKTEQKELPRARQEIEDEGRF